MDWNEIVSALAALGSLATALSLVYVALQTREARRQSELANRLAKLGAHDRLTDLTVQIDVLFVHNPHLRKYFYSGEGFGELVGDDLHQVLAMAELLCDFMENALQHESFDSEKITGEWRDYCFALLRDSSAIRAFLHENEHWYSPEIGDMLRKVESSFHHAEMVNRGDVEVTRLSLEDPAELLRPQLDRIYRSSFPPEEREDPEQIFQLNKDRDVFVLRDPHDQSALGFATVRRIRGGVALLEYLAVSPNSRNSGMGGFLLKHVFTTLKEAEVRIVFMELEKPGLPSASHQAARRIRFYERHGCKPVEWITNYWIPNFRNRDQRLPMLLYWRTLDGTSYGPEPEAFLNLYHTVYPNVPPEEAPAVGHEARSHSAEPSGVREA